MRRWRAEGGSRGAAMVRLATPRVLPILVAWLAWGSPAAAQVPAPPQAQVSVATDLKDAIRRALFSRAADPTPPSGTADWLLASARAEGAAQATTAGTNHHRQAAIVLIVLGSYAIVMAARYLHGPDFARGPVIFSGVAMVATGTVILIRF